MIKQIPGWANFLLLWLFYFLVSWGVSALCRWQADLRFIGFITAMFCGAYLAKWRFMNGEWRFW